MTVSTVPLGELAKVVSGGTPKRSESSYFGGDVPWVKIGDMLQGTVMSTQESITQAGLTRSSAKLLPAGTLLLSIFATIGRTAVLGVDAATNQAIAGLIIRDPSRVDRNYLRRYLEFASEQLARQGRGVAQANINLSILRQHNIPLPPIEEQRRIAGVLDAADALRAKRRHILAKLDLLVQAVFFDMFGDPVRNERGWPTNLLAEVATIDRKAVRPNQISEQSSYIGLENITSSGEIKDIVSTSKAGLKSAKYLFTEHHILYGKLRPYLAKIADPNFAGVCSTDILPINPNDYINRCYLLYYLRTPGMVARATSRAVGINLPRLSPKVLQSFEVALPPVDLQRQFHRAEQAVADHRFRLRRSAELLDTLFASLQQRAFRGEL